MEAHSYDSLFLAHTQGTYVRAESLLALWWAGGVPSFFMQIVRTRLAGLACLLLLAASLPADKKFNLSIENIMRGPALYGYEPAAPVWSGDSPRIYFQWKQSIDAVLAPADTYVVNRDGSGLRKLMEDEAKLAPPACGDVSKDKPHTVFTREGDIFIYDRPTGAVLQITKTADAELNPHFTVDGKRIWFTRSNNLYLLTLDGGMLEQLTDIRAAGAAAPAAAAPPQGGRGGGQAARPLAAGEPPKGTDSQEFIKKEERDLLDIIKQKAARREEEEAKKKRENPRKP